VSSALQEINWLHNELMLEAKMTLGKAIRIGELLVSEKAKLKHGGWLKWCEANLSFDQRTARRYVELFRYQVHFKSDSVSDLTSAYAMLSRKRKLLAEWEIKRPIIEKRLEEARRERALIKETFPAPPPLTFEERCEKEWKYIYEMIRFLVAKEFKPEERQAFWQFFVSKFTEKRAHVDRVLRHEQAIRGRRSGTRTDNIEFAGDYSVIRAGHTVE
jgi:hypothetical protein